MSSPDKRAAETGGPAQMRIRLKYADVQTFVEKFAPNISKQGIFIASRTPKPVGTALRFEMLLSDGKSKLLKGEGVVTWVREFDEKNPTRPHGMGVRFSRLDAESRLLLDRIDAFKTERGLRHEEAKASETLDVVGSMPIVESVAVSPVAEAALAAESTPPTDEPRDAEPEPPAPVPEDRPRPASRVVAEPSFVIRTSDDVDVETLLGLDGAALDQRLERARSIARALGTDGLEELFTGGATLASWLLTARDEAGRDAATMVPRRTPRPEPESESGSDSGSGSDPGSGSGSASGSESPSESESASVPAPLPDLATARTDSTPPEPQPPRLPPPPSSPELDEKTLDFDFNFDVDVADKRPAAPAPPPPPPALLGKPPRARPVPPPPPLPAFRSAPIGPAPRSSAFVSTQGGGETPTMRVVPGATRPPTSAEIEIDEAATIDAALDAAIQGDDTLVGATPPPTIEPKATGEASQKKGFFSKLFKK